MIPMIPPTADRILKPTRKTIMPTTNAKNTKPNVANILNQLSFFQKKYILCSFTEYDSNLTI